MIDLTSEQVFPLSSPPAWLVGRTGRTVHRTTLERWAKTGLGDGIVLETTLVGGTRVSSVEAVERFTARLNGQAATPPEDPAPKPTRTPRQRRKSSEDAAAKLEAAGF